MFLFRPRKKPWNKPGPEGKTANYLSGASYGHLLALLWAGSTKSCKESRRLLCASPPHHAEPWAQGAVQREVCDGNLDLSAAAFRRTRLILSESFASLKQVDDEAQSD